MRVVLDTNVFHGHWQLNGASFAYLFHYLNNEQSCLLLPEVVQRETNNLQARELDAAIAAGKTQLDLAARVNGRSVVQGPLSIATAPYDIVQLLEKEVDDVSVFGYDGILQSTVMERALQKRRPFQDNGTGYRDTMIWLSLLAHLLSDTSVEPVAFVSKNRADFFDLKAKDKLVFHPHLADDIRSAGLTAEIIPFDSLDAFVDGTIDKHAHALDHNRVESLIGDELEDEVVRFFENHKPSVLAALSRRFTPRTGALLRASTTTVEIIEGIEDFSVLSTTDLGQNNVYIRVDFDLRIVALAITIPLLEYQRAEADSIDSDSFFDVQINDDAAVVDVVCRPRFEASVVYNRDTSVVSAFEVAGFQLV